MKQPVYFLSHGGGPWPYIPQMKQMFARTAKWLEEIPKTLPEKPKAILSISGHWEEDVFTVSTAAKPPMVYDYGGFPEHTYHIQYSAPGSQQVAARVRELLNKNGLQSAEDSARGFDHGTFVPLVLMYPDADIPVVSMSMKQSYDPAEHIKMGQALQPLRDEGVLIIGSGLSYHNMRGFNTSQALPVSKTFGAWLKSVVEAPDEATRDKELIAWEKAPSARLAHPREDHLIPLMVVAGAAGRDRGHVEFTDEVMNTEMASYKFG